MAYRLYGKTRYRVDIYDKHDNQRYMRLFTKKRDAQQLAGRIRKEARRVGCSKRYSVKVQPYRTRKFTVKRRR